MKKKSKKEKEIKVSIGRFQPVPVIVSQMFADLTKASRIYSAEWLLNDGQTSASLQNDLAKAAIWYAQSLGYHKETR